MLASRLHLGALTKVAHGTTKLQNKLAEAVLNKHLQHVTTGVGLKSQKGYKTGLNYRKNSMRYVLSQNIQC